MILLAFLLALLYEAIILISTWFVSCLVYGVPFRYFIKSFKRKDIKSWHVVVMILITIVSTISINNLIQ